MNAKQLLATCVAVAVLSMVLVAATCGAERPPQAPPIDPRFSVAVAIDLHADGSTSQADSLGVPIVNASIAAPPAPAVEAAVPNLNEAFRRLKAAGYSWKEVEACELCDTCPAGFKYTGETFFVAERSDAQPVAATSVASVNCGCNGQCGGVGCVCSAVIASTPVRTTYAESSCGTESFAAPMYAYEANCGSESYAATYSTPYRTTAAPMRKGLFGGLFNRFRPAPAATYSSGYFVAPRYSSYGACATGNCGY